MHIFIPLWIPIAYLGIGVVILPFLWMKIHKSLKHNAGWTWKTTIFGRKDCVSFRWFFGTIVYIVAWPLAVKEVISL